MTQRRNRVDEKTIGGGAFSKNHQGELVVKGENTMPKTKKGKRTGRGGEGEKSKKTQPNLGQNPSRSLTDPKRSKKKLGNTPW